MSAETERALALLKSSQEVLERSYNRPHVEVREWRSEPQSQAAAPIVRKVREIYPAPRASATMDAESQKAWNAWAEGVSRKVFHNTFMDVITPVLVKVLSQRDERIAKLEAEIAELRKAQPLRSINGGKAA